MVEQAFHKRPVVGSTPALDTRIFEWVEEQMNCFICGRESNAGAMPSQQARSRGGAQTNFCDGKN